MKVTVKVDAMGMGQVLIDGEPLKGVQSTDVSARAGSPTVVTLQMVGVELEVEGSELRIRDGRGNATLELVGVAAEVEP